MKTLTELLREFSGKTNLQRADLAGAEVQLVGVLREINPTYLSFWQSEVPGVDILISHKGEPLRKQLLEYSCGDGVRINAQFTMFSSGGGEVSDTYHFDLVSIVRVYSGKARAQQLAVEKARAQQLAVEKAKREAEERDRSSCFVATAAFGSQHPEVSVLREYRDRILSKDVLGRTAVQCYYAMSPPCARFIATSDKRRRIARLCLGPVISFARRQLETLGRT